MTSKEVGERIKINSETIRVYVDGTSYYDATIRKLIYLQIHTTCAIFSIAKTMLNLTISDGFGGFFVVSYVVAKHSKLTTKLDSGSNVSNDTWGFESPLRQQLMTKQPTTQKTKLLNFVSM